MYRNELLPFKKKLDFILFFAILSLIHFLSRIRLVLSKCCKRRTLMTYSEIERETEALNRYASELLKDSKRANDFFVRVGIYNTDGKLTKEYGGENS